MQLFRAADTTDSLWLIEGGKQAFQTIMLGVAAVVWPAAS